MDPVVLRPANGAILPRGEAGHVARVTAGQHAAGRQAAGPQADGQRVPGQQAAREHAAGEQATGEQSTGRQATGQQARRRRAMAGDRPARLKVGVVGAGRVGAVLGAALARAGHSVVAVSAVSGASRDRASRLLPTAALAAPPDVVAAADLILLTVPDDALPGLVSGLARTGAPVHGRMLAHASGRYGTAVLDPATRRGALPLALHPVMTFTGRPEDVERLTGVCFGVTAPDALRPVAEALVIEMGGESVIIAEGDRDLYHAALAGAANHLTTLIAESAELLRGAGVSEPARMLAPLLSAALDNALRLGDRRPDRPGRPWRRGHGGQPHRSAQEGIFAGRGRGLCRHGQAHRRPGDRRKHAQAGGCGAPARRAERNAAMMPALARDRDALAASRGGLGSPVVLVPTMGALHAGHRALLHSARELAGADGSVLVSVFVNPLQFGPGEDLDRYPRTLDEDMAVCRDEGVAVVFAPGRSEMYPRAPTVTVDPGPAGERLEGEFRPGFFRGVLTVVIKLFALTRPDVAVFGEKDAQQLALVRRMVTDLDLGIEIAPVPIVRDADGLATSSRNRFLSATERVTARRLWRSLRAGRDEAASGPDGAVAAAKAVLDEAACADPPLRLDYVALADPQTFLAATGHGPAVLAVAARVGSTRLIDNVAVSLPPEARS